MLSKSGSQPEKLSDLPSQTNGRRSVKVNQAKQKTGRQSRGRVPVLFRPVVKALMAWNVKKGWHRLDAHRAPSTKHQTNE